jgi:hypothetical protein
MSPAREASPQASPLPPIPKLAKRKFEALSVRPKSAPSAGLRSSVTSPAISATLARELAPDSVSTDWRVAFYIQVGSPVPCLMCGRQDHSFFVLLYMESQWHDRSGRR